MRNQYRMFLRGSTFWCQDSSSGKQESLGTKDRQTAQRLLHARNEAHRQPLINLQIARAYLLVGDAEAATRTWQQVMDEIVKLKVGDTKVRWLVATKCKSFDAIRTLAVLETRAQHFLQVMRDKKVSTNMYLRRIQNFALDMSWLPVPVIPKRQWPGVAFKPKRAITLEEHRAIVAREQNPERRAFYQLLWHLGGSQSDVAFLDAESIDWDARTVAYSRKKTDTPARIQFGEDAERVLRSLPSVGSLFPYLRSVRPGDRSTEFKQRCQGLGISGISLHSYRYAWAQRAQKVAYPERLAQVALGHASKAVHRAYAKGGSVTPPSLESYENAHTLTKVIDLPIDGMETSETVRRGS